MVRLDTPVGGHDASTVHAQGEVLYKSGASIAILVDPRGPSYSVLPGVADDEFDGLVLTALVVLMMTVIVAGGLVTVFRERSKRRRQPPGPRIPDCPGSSSAQQNSI